MLIDMAGEAIARQAEVGAGEIFLQSRQLIFVADIPGFMAYSAFQLRMFAVKRVTGLAMIEFLFAILPIDQLEIAPLVLYMADLALFMFGVGMHTLARFDPLGKVCMAGKTFFRRQFLIESVTFAAVVKPFEKCVRLRKFARRQLRPGHGGAQKQETENTICVEFRSKT